MRGFFFVAPLHTAHASTIPVATPALVAAGSAGKSASPPVVQVRNSAFLGALGGTQGLSLKTKRSAPA